MNFNTHARRMVVLLLAIALAVGSAGLPLAASASLDASDYPNNTAETVSPEDRNPNEIKVLEDGASVEFSVVDRSTSDSMSFRSTDTAADRMALRIAPNGTDVRLLDVTWNAENGDGSWHASNATDGTYICEGDEFVSTAAWCDVDDGTDTTYALATSTGGTTFSESDASAYADYTISHLDEYGDWQGTVEIDYLLNGERKSVTIDVDGDWDDDDRGNYFDDYPFTQPRIVDVVPVEANDTVSSATLHTQTVDNVSAVYDGQTRDSGVTHSRNLDPSDEYAVTLTDDIPTTTGSFENSWYDSVRVGDEGIFVRANGNMIYNQSEDMPRDDWLGDPSTLDSSDTRYMVVYGHGHGIYEELELSYEDGNQEFVLPVNRSEGTPESVDVELSGDGESEVETQVFDSSSEGWTTLDTTTTTNESVSYDIPAEYRVSPYSEFRVVVRGDEAVGASLSYTSASGTGAAPSDGVPGWVWVLIALVVVAGVAYRSYSDDGDDMEFSPRT